MCGDNSQWDHVPLQLKWQTLGRVRGGVVLPLFSVGICSPSAYQAAGYGEWELFPRNWLEMDGQWPKVASAFASSERFAVCAGHGGGGAAAVCQIRGHWPWVSHGEITDITGNDMSEGSKWYNPGANLGQAIAKQEWGTRMGRGFLLQRHSEVLWHLLYGWVLVVFDMGWHLIWGSQLGCWFNYTKIEQGIFWKKEDLKGCDCEKKESDLSQKYIHWRDKLHNIK